TVQLGDHADEFLGPFARRGTEHPAGTEQRLDPLPGAPQIDVVAHPRLYSPVTDWVGECTVCRVLPPPRYMCTPHGRHGSKLRTARMMSMPLKFSLEFSSKIGVFCHASSYGPRVP